MASNILDNALITGGSGMVGQNIDFGIKPTSDEMDITDPHSIACFFKINPNVSAIIHMAAVNLRYSEQHPMKAIDVNINGTTNMLTMAVKLNIPFILISTGAVFSSFNGNMKFSEDCHPNPNCVYGSTKFASEQIALTYDKTILIRTGWLFGGNQKSHYKFVEHAFNNMINNSTITCSNDFYGSTTYVLDFIERMKVLLLEKQYGIHHVINRGVSNAVDVGLYIAQLLQKPDALVISKPFSEVPNCGPIRSLSEVLVSKHEPNMLRDWQFALKEYILCLRPPLPAPVRESTIWSKRTTCRLCDSKDLIEFFNLESTPPANHFVKKPVRQEKIPLDLTICIHCNHIQLLEIVDPRHLYSHYVYVSSTSDTMTRHLKHSVLEFTRLLPPTANILEIGANDGVCIKELLDNGFTNVLGIDPAANIHARHSLPIICDFFGSAAKPAITAKYPSFNLIYAFHCMAHIENIQDVFHTIYDLLTSDGVFIIEVGYFAEVFRTKQFDVIYHEHIDYHTVTALDRFAKTCNLSLFNVVENSIQGGSAQFYFSKNKDVAIDDSVRHHMEKEADIELFNIATLYRWRYSIEKICADMNYIMNSFLNNGKTIAGFGASAKSTTFLHQLKISKTALKYIVDDNIHKQNSFSPGLNIPIKSPEELTLNKVDYIIILSCNFVDEIVSKLGVYRQAGLRVIIPFPEIRII